MKRLILLSSILLSACCTVERKDGYQVIHQCGGPDLGFTSVPVLRKGSLAFKDLNRNTILDPYEDWRLSPDERAADLSARLTPE